ncbi:hypothetical protein ACQEVS_22145 [Streptomyces sp. CA-181903]|uniref:hypothetical protein n=1 Tax=Streptomyces sp. CA-181903 TaxID=3240055 RepID=UPI003D90F23D
MTVDPTGLGPGPGSPAETDTDTGIGIGIGTGIETGSAADRTAGRGGRERGGER